MTSKSLRVLGLCLISTVAGEAAHALAAPSQYQGCYTDTIDRALPNLLGYDHTVESCTLAAARAGYLFAGLQWYGECWGGNGIPLGYSRVSDSECTTPCVANPGEICGGGWRNSVYTSVASPILAPAQYQGCFTDDGSNRALPSFLGYNHTVESCTQAAASAGYLFAGLQWYGECFAGNTLGHNRVTEAECSTHCNANPSQICGASFRNSVYSTVSHEVPAGYIARQYTEIAGRIPDGGGWNFVVSQFQNGTCTVGSLSAYSRDWFNSAEFTGLGYNSAAKVLVAYRALLDREPTQAEFDLDVGRSFSAVVDDLLRSSDYYVAAGAYCSGKPFSLDTVMPPDMHITVPGGQPASVFTGTTADQLNAALIAAAGRPDKSVQLPQQLVLRTDKIITVPSGVTLSTQGLPDRGHYANMARIVRNSLYAPLPGDGGGGDAPLVVIQASAQVTNVWIDGKRKALGFNLKSQSVDVIGATGNNFGFTSRISNSKLSASAGWTSIKVRGNGAPCDMAMIEYNLITSYPSRHFFSTAQAGTNDSWSDGVSTFCEGSMIQFNQIVDATDAAVVLFRTSLGQHSIVFHNDILAAQNSTGWGVGLEPLAIDFDPQEGLGPDGLPRKRSFFAAQVVQNTLWTGPKAHFDMGIGFGTASLYGTRTRLGEGGFALGNGAGGRLLRVNVWIGVSGWYHENIGMLTEPGSGNGVPSDYTLIGTAENGVAMGIVPAAFAGDTGTHQIIYCTDSSVTCWDANATPQQILLRATANLPFASGPGYMEYFTYRNIFGNLGHWGATYQYN